MALICEVYTHTSGVIMQHSAAIYNMSKYVWDGYVGVVLCYHHHLVCVLCRKVSSLHPLCNHLLFHLSVVLLQQACFAHECNSQYITM